jgi:hypothetical protein
LVRPAEESSAETENRFLARLPIRCGRDCMRRVGLNLNLLKRNRATFFMPLGSNSARPRRCGKRLMAGLYGGRSRQRRVNRLA